MLCYMPLGQGFSNCGPWAQGGPQALKLKFYLGAGGPEFHS